METKDYRYLILDNIKEELEGISWVELPDLTRDFIGHFGTLNVSIEYPLYLQTELPNGYQIVLGFGDENPEMWNGVLYWQIQKDYDTHPLYFSGEMANGSPFYVLWCLFEQLEEALKKGSN